MSDNDLIAMFTVSNDGTHTKIDFGATGSVTVLGIVFNSLDDGTIPPAQIIVQA